MNLSPLSGYIVYGLGREKSSAIGIVSGNGEAKAISSYNPSILKDLLIAVEDRRFYSHQGLDALAIARAAFSNVKAAKIKEGASTITQQAARALMRDNSRTLMRKFKEMALAIKLEKEFSKESILDVYFSEVYYGRSNRGVRSASLAYFDKELHEISYEEALILIALLRGPNCYLANPSKMLERTSYFQRTISGAGYRSSDSFQVDIRTLQRRARMFGPFREKSLHVLSPEIDHKKCTIETSINACLQESLADWQASLNDRVSIVVTNNNAVLGSSSWLGPDHPLLFRTNVGSTLKPFLFVILRKMGIPGDKKFKSTANDLGLKVREARYFDSPINLREALLNSNNNAFLDAVAEVGVECCLQEISNIIKLPAGALSLATFLGATRDGLTLSELAIAYNNFFADLSDPFKIECTKILEESALKRLGKWASGFELKTGTTNNGKEHFAIIGTPNKKIRIAIMREGGGGSLFDKDGFITKSIRKIQSILHSIECYANAIT